ncbi:MAG: polyprenyl synthetase family protein [Bacillota bacterium]
MTSINNEFKLRFKPALTELNKFINERNASTESVFNQAQDRLLNAGGKRIRSLLFLIVAGQADNPRDRISAKYIEVAAAIEILHMATLVHDDIVDQARLRRGQPSALEEFGSEPALFIGDYFLSRAYQLFFKNLSADSLRFLSGKLPDICAGQMSEFNNRHNYDISIRDYLKQVRRKTGLLFGVATYSGAVEAGYSKLEAAHYYRFGLALGMAFQIQDDLLDFTEEADKIGKPPLQDVRQGIYTLPVILLMKNSCRRDEFKELVLREEYGSLLELLQAEDMITEARKFEDRFFDRARAELSYFAKGDSRDNLEFILNCQYKRRE